MNFEEEDYVRVYTRDTPNWLAMGWEARCVLLQMMRKIGRRSGELELDGLAPEEAVASLIAMPVEVVRVGLAKLFERGTARLVGGTIVLPKFLKAQWAPRSSAARKRESREAQRILSEETTDEILAEKVASVTNGHSGHEKSPSSQSNPSQSKPNQDTEEPRSPAARSNPSATTSKALEKPELLGETWSPPEKALEAALVKFECTAADVDRMLPNYRYYWISGKGAGTRRSPKSWVRTWMNRMAFEAKSGELYSSKPNGSKGSREVNPPARTILRPTPPDPEAAKVSLDEQRQLALMAAGVGRRMPA